MGNVIKWVFGQNKDEQTLIKALLDNQLNSRRVVGRGTVLVDANEVRATEKYQDMLKKAEKIVSAR